VKQRNRRTLIAGVLSTILVVAFAALGGVGFAKGSITAAQYQYGKNKITICHKGKNTITISQAAWPAHKKHGDTLGPCTNGHKNNKGKHKGEGHHAPNPSTGTGSQGSNPSGPGNGHGHGPK
jgi:hypothetical protein